MNKKVYIRQDGTIPGHRIIEELERRGGLNSVALDGTRIGAYYYIKANDNIFATKYIPPEYYNTELLYNKETDSFYEKNECYDCVNTKGCINCQDGDMKETYWGEEAPSAQEATKSMRMQAAEAKEALFGNGGSLNDLPFGAYDSKLEGYEWTIPEGYEAIIEDGKVIVRKKIWQPEDGEVVYVVRMYADELAFYVERFQLYDDISQDIFREYVLQRTAFPTKEEAQAFCDRLNTAIAPVLKERRKEVEG